MLFGFCWFKAEVVQAQKNFNFYSARFVVFRCSLILSFAKREQVKYVRLYKQKGKIKNCGTVVLLNRNYIQGIETELDCTVY